MANIIINGESRPSHSIVDRNRQNKNGIFIPVETVYVASGSIDNVVGSTTGSVTIQIDTYACRLKRIEVFHSGASPSFDVSLESRTPNTGSNFDPRHIVVEYNGLQGSDDFSQGIDQVEDITALTDIGGNLYVNFKPVGSGNNSFKYLMFFEAVMVYINKDNTFA